MASMRVGTVFIGVVVSVLVFWLLPLAAFWSVPIMKCKSCGHRVTAGKYRCGCGCPSCGVDSCKTPPPSSHAIMTTRVSHPPLRRAVPPPHTILTTTSPPPMVQHRVDPHAPTIFVSLPEYRDPETPFTLMSLFERAAVPSRVFVGMCSQRAHEDDTVFALVRRETLHWTAPRRDAMLAWLSSNVRALHMEHTSAEGPLYARSMIERRLYRGEDFVMMIDSHMQSAPEWDVGVLNELRACPSYPRAVLTNYSESYDRSNRNGADFGQASQKLVSTLFEEASGMPMWSSAPIDNSASSPPLTHGWAAGFSVAPRAVVEEVPFNDHNYFRFLFFGEEVSMAMRYFTHGIDLYAPRRCFMLTTYDRSYRPLFWDNGSFRADLEEESRARMRRVLSIGTPVVRDAQGRRGIVGAGFLGTRRTVEEYEQFSGIDLVHKTIKETSR